MPSSRTICSEVRALRANERPLARARVSRRSRTGRDLRRTTATVTVMAKTLMPASTMHAVAPSPLLLRYPSLPPLATLALTLACSSSPLHLHLLHPSRTTDRIRNQRGLNSPICVTPFPKKTLVGAQDPFTPQMALPPPDHPWTKTNERRWGDLSHAVSLSLSPSLSASPSPSRPFPFRDKNPPVFVRSFKNSEQTLNYVLSIQKKTTNL